MAKRSPKVRAAQKRAQRKHNSARKAAQRRINPAILPKPIRQARNVTRDIERAVSEPYRQFSGDFGGYELPPPEPIQDSAYDELNSLSVDEKRAIFEDWSNHHSHKPASRYEPNMSDQQVADAYRVFVWNKQQGYGTGIAIGPEIWEYMHDYDLDHDLDDADRERYL